MQIKAVDYNDKAAVKALITEQLFKAFDSEMNPKEDVVKE